MGGMPRFQQRIEALEVLDPRRANQAAAQAQQQAAQQAQQARQQARVAAHREAIRAQERVWAQQEQNAQRLINEIHGYVNGPPPAHALGPWMDPMNPLPIDPPGAAAHPPPRVVRQRTNPYLDQRQPGIADQAPHRTGTLLPEMGHMNPGLLQDAAFDGLDNPWQMEALQREFGPLQPAHQDNLIFAPMPQPQAQGWNPAGDPNWNPLELPGGMPPVPPIVNGEQPGLDYAGVIADWPEVINSQPVWR